jgi:very-short-patch-repair endonuclease
MRTANQPQRGEVLVAIMNNQRDFGILREQLWYRIPVATAPKRWPPTWLAFYQTKVFGDEAYAVHYYGRVRDIRAVRRRKLFPQELPNPKSDRHYYQVHLDGLERLERPILSRRWRRIVFIPTTWHKFTHAAEINDLYDESPLEDRLWAELKRLEIAAERQWALNVGKAWYFLDFALFCVSGRIDVETDGDTWHADPARIPEDNRRDNDLETTGWHLLRFNGQQVREQMSEYCIPKIAKMINRLDGLQEEGLVPRAFHSGPDGVVQQLSLFERGAEYEIEEDPL